MNICAKCKTNFEITKKDQDFYEKISVPSPTFCPPCRNQRRMSFRNEMHLYQRSCDLCQKSILSIYEATKPFPVYCHDCWWSDKWDPRDFSQEYDETLPFFLQLHTLFSKVPHLGNVTAHCENCEYTNFTNYSKNCYLIFGGHDSEGCYYGWRVINCHNCLDCLQIYNSQYCYECIDCDQCYELAFSQDCSNCSNSAFLYDCRNCQDCLFSTGLRTKQFCIFNKQYSQEEYEKEKQKFQFGSRKFLEEAKNHYHTFVKNHFSHNNFLINCEDVSGQHLINCKNVRASFNSKNVHDGAYLEACEDLKDALDCTFTGWPAEIIYEGISNGVNCYNCKFCDTTWSCLNSEYCSSCHHSKELFGCFGLHSKNSYCILNKQYSPDDYQTLKTKIIENMKLQKEYGEFFPENLSPVAYNETVANDFHPLSKEAAIAQGFHWKEENIKDYKNQTYTVPDQINDVHSEILKETLACSTCNKNYKITAQELEFHKRYHLPIPKNCFHCRHKTRMGIRHSI